jgi:hypothetical protein
MKQYLLVDGYNMIGAWPELRQLADDSLEDARDGLLEMMANYQGFSGKKVIVVFDAHQVPGAGSRFRHGGVEVIFTKEKETADEVIERLAGELSGRRSIVQVATSDSTEQHVAFGRGALRVSARELAIAVREAQEQIRRRLDQPPPRKSSFDQALSAEMKELMEKWRRGQQ